jgi:hypothetical protein
MAKKNYGSLYYSALFFEKLLSKQIANNQDAIDSFKIGIYLLKELDTLQRTNYLVTYSFATDSLRVYYKGLIELHIQARKHRVILWIPPVFNSDIAHAVIEQPDLFKPEIKPNISWIFSEPAAIWLIQHLKKIWEIPVIPKQQSEYSHPRHIPGEVRQAVLTEFLNSGRMCPGVAGLSKPHKVSSNMRIEFDHILPYSLGGSNTLQNVQILCSECNSLKRATAN